MNTREATMILEFILDDQVNHQRREALTRAKQVLEILAVIEEKIGPDMITIARAGDRWIVTLDAGTRVHNGEDLVDALGQATTVLALE